MSSKLKARLKQWFYGSCPGVAGAFPYFGVRTYFPPNSLIFRLACAQGIYEADNMRLLLSGLRPDTTVFDVGANIGLMSIPLLAHDPSITMVSVEPSPANHAALKRTADQSPFRDRWEIVKMAVSDCEGEAELHCAPDALGAFDSLGSTQRTEVSRTIRVPLTTLDQVWAQRGRPRVSVIKLDVEGAEWSALRGGMNCLRANRPLVLVEWTDSNLRGFNVPSEALLDFAREVECEVFAMPTLTRVASAFHLRSLMQFGESFVLLPHS